MPRRQPLAAPAPIYTHIYPKRQESSRSDGPLDPIAQSFFKSEKENKAALTCGSDIDDGDLSSDLSRRLGLDGVVSVGSTRATEDLDPRVVLEDQGRRTDGLDNNRRLSAGSTGPTVPTVPLGSSVTNRSATVSGTAERSSQGVCKSPPRVPAASPTIASISTKHGVIRFCKNETGTFVRGIRTASDRTRSSPHSVSEVDSGRHVTSSVAKSEIKHPNQAGSVAAATAYPASNSLSVAGPSDISKGKSETASSHSSAPESEHRSSTSSGFQSEVGSSPFGDIVARFVQDFYINRLLKSSKIAKPNDGSQWTVLAAFVVLTDPPENEDASKKITGIANDIEKLKSEDVSPEHYVSRWLKDQAALSQSSGENLTDPQIYPFGLKDVQCPTSPQVETARASKPAVALQNGRTEVDEASRHDGSAARLELLTLATGVKCVGGNERTPEERAAIVLDMHAEILARRELECLLMEEMEDLICGKTSYKRERILELVPSQFPPRFRVRPNKRIYLYTSHAPCGPAANAAHLARLDREDRLIKKAVKDKLASDAKYAHIPQPTFACGSTFRSEKSQARPLPTKKPSRADAKPTTAYTCSDKLSRYQLMGLQGGRLASFMDEPIRMAGIIVGDDFDRPCLQMLFGGNATYSRLKEGVDEMRGADGNGNEWLGEVAERPLGIFHCAVPFQYSRYQGGADPRTVEELLPLPDDPGELAEIALLPVPHLRDRLIPKPVASPAALSCSYRSGLHVEAFTPAGTSHGAVSGKPNKDNVDKWASRLSRLKMNLHFDHLCETMNDVGQGTRISQAMTDAAGLQMERVRVSEHRKRNRGWIVLSGWMEDNGPFKAWHRGPEAFRRRLSFAKS